MSQETPKVYVSNAFSLQMVTGDDVTIRIRKGSIEEVKQLLQKRQFISAVGHESTAKLMSILLGIPINVNRITITLKPGDILIVFQLRTGRLPTATELTESQLQEIIISGLYEFRLVEIFSQ
jgi:hypothetical protein